MKRRSVLKLLAAPAVMTVARPGFAQGKEKVTYAYLLDRPTTVPLDSPLVIFDTRTCPESQLQLVMFQLMEYVTGTVQRHWAKHRTDAVKPGAPMFLGRSPRGGSGARPRRSASATGRGTWARPV